MEAVDPGKLEKAVAALDTASAVTDRLAALAADMEANSIDPAAAQEMVNTGSEIVKGINPTAGIIMAGIGTLGVRWLKRDQLKS